MHKNNQSKSPSLLFISRKRLAFYPLKKNGKVVLSSSVNKHKATNILYSVQQNFIEYVSIANATENISVTITENSATTLANNTSEISDEDEVIEASPMQRNVASKVKQCLKLERKIPVKRLNFSLCPSPNKDQLLTNKMDNFNLDDTENKPPEKKMLLDKFNV